MLVAAALGCDQGGIRTANYHTSPDVAEKLREKLVVQSAGGGAAAELADPTGFATIRGMFKISGNAPQMARLAVTGDDASLCAPGGQGPLSEEVVAGPGGELANVVIFLDSKIPQEWEHEDYAATRDALLAGENGFDQKQCLFLSHVFAMRSTQTVEIINSDGGTTPTSSRSKAHNPRTTHCQPTALRFTRRAASHRRLSRSRAASTRG